MKAVLALLLILSMPLTTAAQVKIGMSSSADPKRSGEYVWVRAFADSLQAGGISTTIYPGSSLGNELVRSEQVMLGLLEVNLTGGQDLSDISGLYRATELPFIFRDIHEVAALIATTDFLHQVNAETGPRGVLLVDFAYIGGMSGLFTARKAARSIDDMPQFRLRAMSAQQLGFIKAWGAAGTQVAWEEVPQALQTGIADGYLNAPLVPVLFGHGGQLDYFTDIAMSPSMRSIVFSKQWYSGLDQATRLIVDQAVVEARATLRAWLMQTLEEEFALLESIGIERVELSGSQRDEFRKRVTRMYAEIAPPEATAQIETLLATIRASR